MEKITQFLNKFIRPDLVLHGKYSFLVLAATVAFMAVSYWIGLSAVSTMLLLSGWVAGLSVEGSQDHDNKVAEAEGKPKVHGVSLDDAFASAFANTLLAIVYEALRAFHWLPSWAQINWDRIPPWMS